MIQRARRTHGSLDRERRRIEGRLAMVGVREATHGAVVGAPDLAVAELVRRQRQLPAAALVLALEAALVEDDLLARRTDAVTFELVAGLGADGALTYASSSGARFEIRDSIERERE